MDKCIHILGLGSSETSCIPLNVFHIFCSAEKGTRTAEMIKTGHC